MLPYLIVMIMIVIITIISITNYISEAKWSPFYFSYH